MVKQPSSLYPLAMGSGGEFVDLQHDATEGGSGAVLVLRSKTFFFRSLVNLEIRVTRRNAVWGAGGIERRSLRDGREKEARRELGKRVWPAKTGQERVRIIGDRDSMRTVYKACPPPKGA